MLKRKYLFIIKDLYGGGAEKVLINTAELLVKQGQEVIVYTLRDRIEHDVPSCVTVKNIGCVNRMTQAFSNVLLEKFQAALILQKIRNFSPDVVISCACDKITRHLPDDLNLYYWVHGSPLNFKGNVDKSCRKFIRFYEGKKLICVSHGMADDIRKSGVKLKELRVIYNPFNIEYINQRAEESITPPFAHYFLHVASFEERKRHDRLLDAYALSGVDTPLLIMGKGGKALEIKNRIKELKLEHKVMVMDFQKNPFPYIKRAKALLLTSDAEGLPTVLIEALICHVPVISSNCPSGPSEILVGKLRDYLVECEDIAGLAQAIRQMDIAPPAITPEYYQAFASRSVISEFLAL